MSRTLGLSDGALLFLTNPRNVISGVRRHASPVPLLLLLAALSLSQMPVQAATRQEVPAATIAVIRAGDLFLLDTATGRQIRLTTDGDNLDPAWDPSGSVLTFVKSRPPDPAAVWRWTAAGGAEQAGFPAFWGVVSPDGDSWAYPDYDRSAPNPHWAPAIAWITEHRLRGPISPTFEPSVTGKVGVHWEPIAWSPDSRELALARFNALPSTPLPKDFNYTADTTLWLTVGDPLAGKRTQLQMPNDCCGQLGVPDVAWFSPDGRFLTVGVGPAMPCSSCRADGLPFYAVPVDGGAPIALGSGLARGTVAWAPDDSFVVLSGPLGRFAYTDKHLYLTETATGAQRQLTNDRTAADTVAAVSPNGRLIAFVRAHDPGSAAGGPVAPSAARRIWLATPDGGLRQLDPGADGWGDDVPAWTPDGRWVVFTRSRPSDGTLELWAAPVAGGPPRRLASGLGPPPTGPVAGQQPVFLASDYFAVQPNPAVRATRLAPLGSGGAPRHGRAPLLSVCAGLALLGAGRGLLRLARRADGSVA
ncbi:MAG TPA: hypothetical protein VKV26_02070 [Dehalococcoidia bacterium]|nr:hypothetical protein [Dehalococcoidia bacterium]